MKKLSQVMIDYPLVRFHSTKLTIPKFVGGYNLNYVRHIRKFSFWGMDCIEINNENRFDWYYSHKPKDKIIYDELDLFLTKNNQSRDEPIQNTCTDHFNE